MATLFGHHRLLLEILIAVFAARLARLATGDPILIALLNCFGRYYVDPVSQDWNDMLTVTAEKIEP